MFSSKIAAITVVQTTLLRERFRFFEGIKPALTTLSPNPPIRGGCRVSLQALLCLQTQQVFSPGQAAHIHSNPQSRRSPHPTHIWSRASCPLFLERGGFIELMLRVNFLHVSFSPSFSFFFFFQVPIYLNSFPLFFFLLH